MCCTAPVKPQAIILNYKNSVAPAVKKKNVGVPRRGSLFVWVQLKGLLVLKNYLSSVHYCDDHSRLHLLIRSSNVVYSDIHSHLLITSRIY